MIKNILFDLDCTLLQMDQDEFLRRYFDKISCKVYKELGYQQQDFLKKLMESTGCVMNNNGQDLNVNVFWKNFTKYYNRNIVEPVLQSFYNNEFNEIKEIIHFNPLSKKIIDLCKEKGYRVVLATNPLFPAIATKNRILWAGLKPEMFEHITTYENSSYCKPRNDYYMEICNKLGMNPAESLMVGNDLSDDFSMISDEFSKYLVTDCIINTKNLPITMPCGSLEDLYEYIKQM